MADAAPITLLADVIVLYCSRKLKVDKGGPGPMRLQLWKSWKKTTSYSLYLKCSAIFFFLMLSVLIVACGGNSSTNPTDLGNPEVTVTIRLGGGNASPTPPLPDYSCGAWATDTSPASTVGSVNVYA